MTFDAEKVWQSKRELRRELASRPIAQKLATLDALRERALTLRAANEETKARNETPEAKNAA